ncbi:MAG: hypothetical protein KF858_00840 [Candidatus Sumerlaeia bacterium]|nr:hypothetical protein [Candidatus Sumerlaeia bacterium]
MELRTIWRRPWVYGVLAVLLVLPIPIVRQSYTLRLQGDIDKAVDEINALMEEHFGPTIYDDGYGLYMGLGELAALALSRSASCDVAFPAVRCLPMPGRGV